jgi:beta-glucosidase
MNNAIAAKHRQFRHHLIRFGNRTRRTARWNHALCVAGLSLIIGGTAQGQTDLPTVPAADLAACRQKADALMARMTSEEKIGQLVLISSTQVSTGASTNLSPVEQEILNARCGNVFNAFGSAYARRLQQIAVGQTRLKIPLLLGFDVIHGFKTTFPIPLGEAASWDTNAIERADRVAAIEATAAGLNWTFAPMVDIARDPRWGRIAEGAGEDPFLGSAIARAAVRGFQGTNLSDPSSLLACPKHFAAYGAAQAGRDYSTADVSERTLREVYLPPFHAAVDAGALSIMSGFDELNGIPATANRFLLQQVLRDEWGFQGFVVSDYTSINELVNHGIAANEYDAGRAALKAGLDMDLQGFVYHDHLLTMLRNGDVTQKQVDDAVRRVLTVKFALGLFDDPFRHTSDQRESVLDNYPAEHLAAAYHMASESLVLLKNEKKTLPLKSGLKLAVIGPLADSPSDLLGCWSGAGDPRVAGSMLEAIKHGNVGGQVSFVKGCDVSSDDKLGFNAALEAARRADVVVMVVGESADMCGEASSRTSINLPGVQTELVRQIAQTGKPLILVLLNGRPLALEKESSLANAMLEAWFPGTKGAEAVADVLFGKSNPSGRLPVTFPRNLGQVPIYYSVKHTGRPINPAKPHEKYKSNYLDAPNDPLYPFGYGLSYTSFSYSGPKLDRDTIHPGESITVTVDVTNSGKVDGIETPQLYIHDLVADVGRPVLELKGFQRVELKAGGHREISFVIGEKELAFLRADMTWGTEPGKFDVFVGPNSRDLQSARFELVGGLESR